jgi:heat shock protein HslJ
LTGEDLSFSQLETTMMACEEHLSQQESRFLEVLKALVRFEISPEGPARESLPNMNIFL